MIEWLILLAQAIDWCIGGVAFLSDYDIVHMDIESIDPRKVMIELQLFQNEFPPPKADEIQLLSDSVAAMEDHWGRESFQFALNRILELHDRFELYHKILEEMVEEKYGGEGHAGEDVEKDGMRLNRIKPVSKTIQKARNLGLRRVGSAPTIRKNRKSPDSHDFPDGRSPLDHPDIGLQISVVDVDVKAHEALDILDKTAEHVRKLSSRTSIPVANNLPDADSLSLLEFLDSIKEQAPPKAGGLKLPDMRTRSYSAPEDGTGSDDSPKRPMKHHVRNTLISNWLVP